MQYGIKWLFTLEICCRWYTIKNINTTFKNILFIVNVLLLSFRINSKYSILQKKVISNMIFLLKRSCNKKHDIGCFNEIPIYPCSSL